MERAQGLYHQAAILTQQAHEAENEAAALTAEVNAAEGGPQEMVSEF